MFRMGRETKRSECEQSNFITSLKIPGKFDAWTMLIF